MLSSTKRSDLVANKHDLPVSLLARLEAARAAPMQTINSKVWIKQLHSDDELIRLYFEGRRICINLQMVTKTATYRMPALWIHVASFPQGEFGVLSLSLLIPVKVRYVSPPPPPLYTQDGGGQSPVLGCEARTQTPPRPTKQPLDVSPFVPEHTEKT